MVARCMNWVVANFVAGSILTLLFYIYARSLFCCLRFPLAQFATNFGLTNWTKFSLMHGFDGGERGNY